MTHPESGKTIRLTIFHLKIFILIDKRRIYYQLLQDVGFKSVLGTRGTREVAVRCWLRLQKSEGSTELDIQDGSLPWLAADASHWLWVQLRLLTRKPPHSHSTMAVSGSLGFLHNRSKFQMQVSQQPRWKLHGFLWPNFGSHIGHFYHNLLIKAVTSLPRFKGKKP